MVKNKTVKGVAKLFGERLTDENIISDIFDYMRFDCSARSFIDPTQLDARIKAFCENRSIDALISVIELIQEGKEAASMDDGAILRSVKKYITDHLLESVSFEQLANEFHISYYYLCHLFKSLAGQSLSRFRTEKRLERAMRMLVESDIKVSDIALASGFDNPSYFSETFIKFVGETPSEFRAKNRGRTLHGFYEFRDILLLSKMQSISFAKDLKPEETPSIPFVQVHNPTDGFGRFLHEAAIIEYEGVLYASWYNCPETELVGYTPIVERRSYDGGKTWTEAAIVAEDKSEKIMYCPPVYGICDGNLYMLMNQMVSADYMHSLDLYVLNKESDKFELLWSRPIPFKLNTNVVSLPNGKLLLPGRIGELDGFPTTPAVLISDNGKIDAEWRVVYVAENGILADGESLVYPEATVVFCDGQLYMFNRNDKRNVPLVYISKDLGESWSEPLAHDIPYVSSKIYSGQLSDGRFYLIANTDRADRSKLVLYLSEKNKLNFTRAIVLADCETSDNDMLKCHYPFAVEYDGKLLVIATVDYVTNEPHARGAVMFFVDLT